MSKINFYSKKFRFDANIDFKRFKIYDFDLIKSFINKSQNINKYHLYTKIYRKDKDYYFNLYIEIIQNEDQFFFSKIKIIGIFFEDTLIRKKIKPFNQIISDSINNSYNFKIPNTLNINKNYNNHEYKCFLKNSKTKFDCISNDPNGLIGVWDKPCISNFECPFYKKNKNYPNTRGGCIDGKCELPIGSQRVGYSHYALKPFCHNCKDKKCVGVNCNRCCDSKKDYAYMNDFYERYKYRNILRDKNLPINGLNV